MSRSIAYVCSRFPVLREAFIIREVLALERAGVDVRVYSLKRPATDLANQDLDSIRTQPYYSAHFLSAALIRDNLATFLRMPLRYLAAPFAAAWRFRRYPVQAVKCLALFPKMIHYGRQMRRDGVAGINACWASLPTLQAYTAQRFFALPYAMTCRAWDIFVPMNQMDLAVKVGAAALVRTNNDSGAEFMRRFCSTSSDEAKIRRVYNPFDVAAVRPREALPAGPVTITSGGSLVEQKGLTYLLDALALLVKEGLNYRLQLVGEGAERDALEQQARQLGIAERVEIMGTLPNNVFLERMRASHAFILPSVPATSGCMDGIPNVLIESMALGVPVISTSISGIPELIEDGVCGLLVPPRDSTALAAAMRLLLEDRELQQSFSAAGRTKVETLFEMSRNADELIEVYRSAGLL
jgi:colanic acid/amylovoran biosynthesis glycosyltransferase